MEEFRSTRDGALVGASIAKRKGWGAGDSVDLRDQLGIMMTVSGVFFSGNEETDNTILADIEYVQDQYDGRGKANSIMVKLEQDADSDEVAAAIDKLDGPVGTSTQAETAYVSGMIEDLNDMISLSALVILITLAVVFVSVANTISMSVRDRTRQIGMMRTLGFKRWMVMLMVVAEAAMICVLGGAIGTGGAWLLLMFQDVTVQARSLNLAIAMPWDVVATALAVSLGIGVVGSIWPGFRGSRMKMVEAIGSAE